MAENESKTEAPDKLVSIATYTRLCGLKSVQAIHARLDKGDPEILQLSKVPGVEGVFINTKIYPPKKYPRGWKLGKKRKKADELEEIDINHFIGITVDLAHDHIKDISDPEKSKQEFLSFMIERHKKIEDKISFEEFCTLVKNYKA